MKTKKITALLLTLFLILGFVPAIETAQAADPVVPTSLTLDYQAKNVINKEIIVKKGDTFQLTACDQNGELTPVSWKKNSGSSVTLDSNTGLVTVTGDTYCGSSSYLTFTATSTLDNTVTKKLSNVKITGYLPKDKQKNQRVALSADGQTATTASITAGKANYTVWSYNIPEGVGELAQNPGKGTTLKFNVFRPGKIDVAFHLDTEEEPGDIASITVTGVAVETEEGAREKAYIALEDEVKTLQLKAFAAAGRTISGWSSGNESVATVDENGLVTAKGVGSAIISAADSEGTKGGIKIVVTSEERPYFESLEFATTSLASGAWVKDSTFSPTQFSYDLPMKNYSTSTLQATTLYNADKYEAFAEYTDENGVLQKGIPVNSGAPTSLPNQPFGSSVLTITLTDKTDTTQKTVYTFNVTRPRDETKNIKNNGIVLVPEGRSFSATTYNGLTEGTMQKCSADGEPASGTGVSSSCYYYRTFLYNDAKSFRLELSSSTNYAHIRYSADGGTTWKELAQSGDRTEPVAFGESAEACVIIQILDDKTYTENIKNNKAGFDEGTPTEYKLRVDSVTALASSRIVTAETDAGDWYPAFSPDRTSYWIVIPNSAAAPTLTFKAEEGCTVKVGSNEQTPGEDGCYSLPLKTAQQSITVTSADKSSATTYKFGYRKKSALDVPDKVTDYLCIGSQYTNTGSYGYNPEVTLAGTPKSLGNFGGYITYYYETPITDNPRNKYGLDFYVTGNSSETNIDSMAELGQVYISEDGSSWYALAGSEHYEEKAVWDYTITYTKTAAGKAEWTDNLGNKIGNTARVWPDANYYMNDVHSRDSYTFTGIAFECQQGGMTGDSTTSSFAASAKFGYADYYNSNISGTTLTDVNSYVEKPSKANGFDVAWAVDKDGNPVDVSGKKFHYIRVATASNIWAGSFGEKSTEVTYVVRTTPQESEVGKTAAPTGVTISDGAESRTITFTEDRQIYDINLGSMKYVSVTVNGTAAEDNIYVNNQRTPSGTAAEGFKVTKEKGKTLVRVIVQNGDKEPQLYLLRLTGSAEESSELLEGIKLNVSGSAREAATKNGSDYTAAVGHKIDKIAIIPKAAQNVTVTIDGEAPRASYDLSYGANSFTVTAADKDGKTEATVLTVTRDNPPAGAGTNITVWFTLYGDTSHGESASHTYKSDKRSLPVWIVQKPYTVDASSTVLDVLEKALTEAGLSWENAGGNYISEINNLAEFDNGSLSGWMYLLNGSHGGLGVAEQSLKNGDKIIFHYTDDYTQEQGSEIWHSSHKASTTKTEDKAEDKTEDKTELLPAGEEAAAPFKDLQGHWANEAALYVYSRALMQGVTAEDFAPDSAMTRAMLITVLYRLEKPASSAHKNQYTDVPEGAWYLDALLWADENQVVTGTEESIFSPDEPITREQLAVILYRYAQLKGYITGTPADLSAYTDADAVSPWAREAMAWAVAEGIISGTGENTLSPGTGASRGQIAAVIMRFCEKSSPAAEHESE